MVVRQFLSLFLRLVCSVLRLLPRAVRSIFQPTGVFFYYYILAYRYQNKIEAKDNFTKQNQSSDSVSKNHPTPQL